jgi:hypothetical protein
VLTHNRQKRSASSKSGTGDRSSSEDEEGGDEEEDDLHVEPATWRKVSLVMHRPDDVRSDIVLLRPIDWFEAADARVGGFIWLDMPEMSCSGLAKVVSIDPCPEIEEGGGRIVTGTFAHSHGELLDIQVSGRSKPVGATAKHPFWSEDRQNWVSAGNLVSGERLRTVNGTALVQSITPRFTPQSVYNIEVSVDHTYLVTDHGVLVHNASGGCVVRAANIKKGIPASQLGPSGKPKIHVKKHSSVKRAKDSAKTRAGRRGSTVKHPTPNKGGPHFHGVKSDGTKIRVHDEYPE